MHRIDPYWIAVAIGTYFLLLLIIGRLTARKNDNSTFFIANRNAPWYLVAFGMIGTSISGITFISIPGTVGFAGFSYFQVVLGYILGYLVIAFILMPMYYRLNLISIYVYLKQRYGVHAYKTGSFYFLLSRSVGSALRLMLAVSVFQIFIFNEIGIPFQVSVIISMVLILLYSIRGGIKTIIWTDALQTFFLILSLILTIVFLTQRMGFDLGESIDAIYNSNYSRIIHTDWLDKNFFWKQFFGG
ncbi:MAG: sodium:solute symporter, partial [Bacteroidota bacterium]|nr:sodium:solute symporter [Bacteroidota bacterium]